MMILIFGVGGMAGHVLYRYFSSFSQFEVWGTVHSPLEKFKQVHNLDVRNRHRVLTMIRHLQPDVVVNAIGLLNLSAQQNISDAIYVNALFPRLLAHYAKTHGFKLVHISTDCVFSGQRGNYMEQDIADGTSVYAKSKSLGEVVDDGNLTIRTSIIGPELKPDGIGLLGWFLQQKGPIYGYRQVLWNGVTTMQLARAIHWSLSRNITGLAHLGAPNKISKYELLNMCNATFHKSIPIIPSDEPQSDKSLLNTRTDFCVPLPPYEIMLEEMKQWMEINKSLYV